GSARTGVLGWDTAGFGDPQRAVSIEEQTPRVLEAFGDQLGARRQRNRGRPGVGPVRRGARDGGGEESECREGEKCDAHVSHRKHTRRARSGEYRTTNPGRSRAKMRRWPVALPSSPSPTSPFSP